MKKIFQKSLALAVSAALCLTAFVGVVSATGEDATAVIATVQETTGTASTNVTVTLTGISNQIAAARFDIIADEDVVTIGDVDDDGLAYEVGVNKVDTDTYRVLVNVGGNTLATVQTVTFDLPCTILDDSADIAIEFGTVKEVAYAGTIVGGVITGNEGLFADVAWTDGGIEFAAPVHEHTWGSWTSDGADTHTRTCSGCDETETEDHSFDEGVTVGYITTYTCTVCGYFYNVDNTPAHVHSYTSEVTLRPTLTATGIRTFTCSGCEDTYEETIPVATLKTNSDGDKYRVGNNLDLKSSIEIGFRVREAFVTDANVVDYYAVFTKNRYDVSGNVTGTVTQVKEADAFTTPADATNRRNVNCNFIASTEMGTIVTAVIYRELSDGTFEAVTKDYSVVTYVDNQLGNNATFDTLLVDMLNYGAAAQINFGYNTANLPTEVSSKYSTYASAASTSVSTTAGDSVSAQDNGVAAGANYSINMTRQLDLKSSINLYFGLRNADKSAYSGTTDLVARFTYTDFSGAEKVVEVPYSEFEIVSGVPGPELDKLTTRDLYTHVTVGVYNGETLVSNVIDYSIASYYVAVCINSPGSYTENLRTLIENMTKYCESAITYFG